MTDQEATIYYSVFLGLAFVVFPASCVVLCVCMLFRRVHWFSYVAHFCLFGTLGGWSLALGLSPSGLAAVSGLFLIFTSPICPLVSLFLNSRHDRNNFDQVAMIGGYIYLGAFVCAIFIGGMLD